MASQQNCIDSPAKPQEWVLQQQMPARRQACQCATQKLDLRTPGANLRIAIDAVCLDQSRGETADDLLRLAREEIGKVG
jgi:hypothetical protein